MIIASQATQSLKFFEGIQACVENFKVGAKYTAVYIANQTPYIYTTSACFLK